jgi:acetyltransferase-like isoleucine patch superfamily enzyme
MFKENERNKNIRSFILKQFVSKVMTDEEIAQLWGLPAGCRMRENAKIISPENLICGGLEIGSHTSIGLNTMIWSHTSFLTNLTMSNYPGSDLIKRAKTKIGNGCFIGGPSVIYPGVTIGDRTVVLPMSVITKDIAGNCIVAGSPAKVIAEVTDEFIRQKIDELKAQK